MKKNSWLGLSLVAMVTLALLFGGAPAKSAPTPVEPPMPKTIVLGTHEVGTGGHKLVAMIAETLIKERRGLIVRAIPAGADTARSYMARLGDSHTTIHTASSTWFLQEGIHEYALLEWGPQPVRYLYLSEHVGMAFAVRGDSPIKTGYDLKGRTVATYPGSPAPTTINEGFLAFFNLTWKEVKPVPYPGPVPAYKAVVEGKLDTAFFNVGASQAYEGAALPVGWRYLDMPATDIEGWKRQKAIVPMQSPKKITFGAGISADKPVEGMAFAYPAFIAWAHLKDDIAYWITKLIVEEWEKYKVKNKEFELFWTIEKHWSLWDQDVVPMHPGAIAYFKTKGMWTPEREKMQDERLARQTALKKLWDGAVDEALAKGVKGADFPKFWMEKRATAGLKP